MAAAANRLFIALSTSLALALVTSGCTVPGSDSLASLSQGSPPPPAADQGRLRAYAEEMAPRYAAHPDDKVIAIRYAIALRGLTRYAQAVAVLQALAVKNPHDMAVLGAYGKALADAGRLQEASEVLERSHTPDRPNWSILSAQGSVADQMGNHAQAQAYYASALKIVPNQPQVLSNLGLSYALEHRMPLAEQTLQQAAVQPGADMRVRQNLALVLSVEGKYDDAEAVSRHDLAPVDAAENVQSIKRMIAQSDVWSGAAARGPKPQPRKVAARRTDRTQTAAADDPR